MITCKLNGGLGNKLFQITATVSLALDNKDAYAFNLNDHVAKQGSSAKNYRGNILSKITELPESWQSEFIYKEPSLSFNTIPYHKNMLLEGYFQSEKYFTKHKKEITDLFTYKKSIDYLKLIYQFKDSLSVHVRRGDYCGVSTCRPLPLSYYDRALFAMDNRFKIKTIYIFSDDIKWCKNTFNDKRIVFMSGMKDYMDLYMMSLCPYNIIANSTFSWWAAYLNQNSKMVIAPYQWGKELGTSDIYCKNWRVI